MSQHRPPGEGFTRARAPKPPGDMVVREELRRRRRVLTFAMELASSLRREFGPFWVSPLPREILALRPRVAPLVAAVDAIADQAESLGRALEAAESLPARDALAAVAAVDSEAIVTATRELLALAEGVRRDGTVRAALAPVTALAPAQPLPKPEEGGGMLGVIRRWMNDVLVAHDVPLPPPPVSPAVERARKAFELAHRMAGEVLAYVSPRLRLVELGITAIGRPPSTRPLEDAIAAAEAAGREAQLAPGKQEWLAPLARLFHSDTAALRAGHVALVQWREAEARMAEADVVGKTLSTNTPVAVGTVLEAFEIGRFNAALVPLANLHATFRPFSPLNLLFPAPQQRA